MAREKYHVFHIVTKPLNGKVYDNWRRLMPDSTALVLSNNIKDLYMVIISIMQLVNGMSRDDVISQWPADVRKAIRDSIKDIKIAPADISK